ncbi:MAG: holo-[acyl-carrier-protein] synthase [Planctomycetia bacterium]|nr:holo-[acyl-carrier-protein] synthase [Planctomycetia bacterium]
MEVIGLGTEIVECLRIGRMIEQHAELFLLRVYTDAEIRFCQSRKRAIEHFAARWAAKEAVLKALGRPWRRGVELTEVEIDQKSGNNPEVRLRGTTAEVVETLGLVRIMLSMSHCRAYATATAIVMRV